MDSECSKETQCVELVHEPTHADLDSSVDVDIVAGVLACIGARLTEGHVRDGQGTRVLRSMDAVASARHLHQRAVLRYHRLFADRRLIAPFDDHTAATTRVSAGPRACYGDGLSHNCSG